jgi:hypothetical protein
VLWKEAAAQAIDMAVDPNRLSMNVHSKRRHQRKVVLARVIAT